MFHHRLPAAVELVRQCPRVQFVLDRIGKPAIEEQRLDPWRAHIREMAALPNVVCKISGLVTEANFEHWSTDQLRPYVEHVIDCFGDERVMFGGDFPVLLQASNYTRWVQALDEITRGAGRCGAPQAVGRQREALLSSLTGRALAVGIASIRI